MPKVDIRQRQKAVAERLLKGPNFGKVRYSKQHGSFVSKQKDKSGTTKDVKLSGLTNILKRHFWPNYKYSRNRYSTGTGARNAHEGRLRGTVVHKQIRDFFNLDEETFFAKYKLAGNKKKSDKHKENIHEYTHKLILAMKKWKIAPIVSEIPCMDMDIKTGTAADGLCIDQKTGGLIMFEWKCGFDHYFLRGNGYMKGPEALTKFSNCPMYQSQLQLAFTKHMFEKTHLIQVDAAWVLNITQDGIVTYPLERELQNTTKSCIEFIKSSNQKIALMKRKKTLSRVRKKTK